MCFCITLPAGQRLSAQPMLTTWRAVLVPSSGGLCMGLLTLALTRWMPRRARRPDRGQRTLWRQDVDARQFRRRGADHASNGVGASVGLEAGYTQIGSAVGSKLGWLFRVRRADLRLLVGCGAAGAIAAAFNAPLTGAFYAFELVIGTYSWRPWHLWWPRRFPP